MKKKMKWTSKAKPLWTKEEEKKFEKIIEWLEKRIGWAHAKGWALEQIDCKVVDPSYQMVRPDVLNPNPELTRILEEE